MYSSCAFTLESLFNLGRHVFKCRLKKNHCRALRKKRIETVKSEYDRQSSWLKEKQSDVVWQQNGFPLHAVKMQAIIEEEKEGSSIFLVEFADILQQVAMQGDSWTASLVDNFLNDTPFDLNTSRGNIKGVAKCKNVSARNTRELMKESLFCRFRVRGSIGKKDGCGPLCVKDVTEVLQQQVEFCGKDETTICPGCGNSLSKAAFPTI